MKNDELQRNKIRQKTTNQAIASYKAIKSFKGNNNEILQNFELAKALLNLPSKALSLNSSLDSSGVTLGVNLRKNIMALKFIIKNFKLTRFDINSDFNHLKFANVSQDELTSQGDNNLKKKINKLLDQRKHKDEIVIPPTEYYDNNLNIIVEAKNYRDILPKLHNSMNFESLHSNR